MRYFIVAAGSTDELNHAVEMALKDGWQLQGGVSAVTYYGTSGITLSTLYMQAVTKPAQPGEKETR